MLDPQTRARIILAADDFGISQLSNENILALLRLKKLDRIAIMMDGLRLPSESEVQELLKSGVKLDIHLNAIQKITSNRALSEPIIPRLLAFGWRFVSGDIRSGVMERKWRDELEAFRKTFGKNPDGISAHQHVHFFPAYFKVVLRLASEFKIPYIRFGKTGLIKSQNGIYLILNFLHKLDEKYFAQTKVGSSDFWFSLDWLKDVEVLKNILPEGKTEVVCHPERETEFEIIKNYF